MPPIWPGGALRRELLERTSPTWSHDQTSSSEAAGPFGGVPTTTLLAWFLLAAAIGLGTWARFHALGLPPLSIDEYYFLTGVESILARGVPEPPGGGYYVRGLPVQYLTALSIMLFGGPELGLRIPMVLLGLASVIAAYVLGRRMHSPELGLALAVVILVSSWSVEFSRFGRMYAGLQLLTLLFLLALDPVLKGQAGRRARYLPHLWAVLAVPTHLLAMMLVPLLAVPALTPGATQRLGGRRRVAEYLIVTGLVISGVLAYDRVPFRLLGVSDRFPEGASAVAESASVHGYLLLPSFPFWTTGYSGLANFLVALTALGVAAGVVQLGRLRGARPSAALTCAVMAVVAALLHQLLLAAVLAILPLARYHIHRRPHASRVTIALVGLAGVISVAWLAYATWITFGLGSRDWMARGGHTVFRYAVSGTFFGWPRFYEPVILPWFREMPVLGGLLLVGVLYQVVARLDRPVAEMVRSPAFVVLYILILVGTMGTLYQTTRYTYFIYPLALAALFLTVFDLLRLVQRRVGVPWLRRHVGAVSVAVCLGAFAVTEDFRPGHLVGVGTAEVMFRTGPFAAMSPTWYPRTDSRAAALFVSTAAPADAPLVAVDVPAASYYIDRPHAVYLDRGGDRFRNVARQRGRLDYWSGQRLLSLPEELAEHTARAAEVWVVRRADGLEPVVDLAATFADRGPVASREFLSVDGRVEVVRVTLSQNRAGGTAVPE